MTVDEALSIVASKASGRTRYEGQEPYLDEVLATEVVRLRAQVEWQPIEMAPHGVLVELYSPATAFCGPLREITYASHGRRVGAYSSISRHPSATHWRPIGLGPGEAP